MRSIEEIGELLLGPICTRENFEFSSLKVQIRNVHILLLFVLTYHFENKMFDYYEEEMNMINLFQDSKASWN